MYNRYYRLRKNLIKSLLDRIVFKKKNESNRFLLIYCPVPSFEIAELIAKHLLSLKLVACVNVFSEGVSFYEWEGQMQKSKEFFMILKTKKKLSDPVFKEIVKKHPYECPSLCGFTLDKAPLEFLKWMNLTVKNNA